MKRLLFVFFLFSSSAFAQGVRYSSTVTQQGTVGASTNVVTLPASPQIAWCNHPANAVPCTNKATTYQDQTLAVACSTSTQIVRDGTSTCVATPDAQNNWGVWVAPNTLGYDYTITLPGGVNLGPFNVLSQTNNLSGLAAVSNLTVSGTMNSNNLATGNVANKPGTVDAVRYVTVGGNDSNDCLSWGTACATIAHAVGLLPTPSPIPSSNNVTQAFSGPAGTVMLGLNAANSSAGYSPPGVINSTMVRIVGVDKFGVQIQCGSTSPCLEFSGANLNGSQFSPQPILGASGGLEKVTLVGSNTANQIGLYNLDAGGINHRDVRITGFTGTSACGMTIANDANGESERVHLDAITWENDTQQLCLTASNGGGLGSIAHQYWTNLQFSLGTGNNQTAIVASGQAQVACEFCSGVINTNLPATNSYTGVSISGSAAIKGFFRMIVDNGAVATFTATSGTTASNFNVTDYLQSSNTIYVLGTRDNPIYNNVTTPNANNGLCFLLSGVQKDCIGLDGSNFLGFFNATPTEVVAVSNAAGGGLWFTGSSSGAANILPAAVAGGTQTIPNLSGTFVLDTPTQNITNKTFTGVTPFPGNTAALTADWTCGTGGTVSSCTSATIIGSGGGVPLTFTLPSVAQSYTLTCDGVVGQATAATANQWNLLTATNGATNVTANYSMATAATASAYGAVTDQASTTTTFQITPSWTLGGTATKMPFHIWAKVEGASSSGTVLSLQLVAPTVGDLVTIYRGTACRIF